MRKTKTKTKRKRSKTTRKKRGGAESSPVYVLITKPLGEDIFNSTNITNAEYSNLTRRIKGEGQDAVQPLDAREIHLLIVGRYPELKNGLDVTEIPTNLEHIIDGLRHAIVARYPRSRGRSRSLSRSSPRGRSRSSSSSSPRGKKRSLSRSSSSSLGSK